MRRLRNIFYSLFLFALVAVIAQDAESRSRMRFRSTSGVSPPRVANIYSIGFDNLHEATKTPALNSACGATKLAAYFEIKKDTSWVADAVFGKYTNATANERLFGIRSAATGELTWYAYQTAGGNGGTAKLATLSVDTWYSILVCTDKSAAAGARVTGLFIGGVSTVPTSNALNANAYNPDATCQNSKFVVGALDSGVLRFGPGHLDNVAIWVGSDPCALGLASDIYGDGNGTTDLNALATPPTYWNRGGDGISSGATLPDEMGVDDLTMSGSWPWSSWAVADVYQ